MGLDVNLIAVRDMEGRFEEMLEVKRFCDERKLSYPAEVSAYFGDLADHSEDVIRSDMAEILLAYAIGTFDVCESDIPVSVGTETAQAWASVNLSDMPKDIKAIKVSLNW